jgi:hypothetical protein
MFQKSTIVQTMVSAQRIASFVRVAVVPRGKFARKTGAQNRTRSVMVNDVPQARAALLRVAALQVKPLVTNIAVIGTGLGALNTGSVADQGIVASSRLARQESSAVMANAAVLQVGLVKFLKGKALSSVSSPDHHDGTVGIPA